MEEELFNESRLFTQREYFANGLINLFKSKELWLEEGVSISIEGEWGIGKTFFKDKFKEMLNTEGFVVLEYNAWKNDYNDDPFSSLISSIISQMENLVNKSNYASKSILRNKLDAVKNSAVDMLGRLIKASPKIIVNRVLGNFDEDIRDACEQAIFSNEKTERIEKIFRVSLKNFISEYYKQLKENGFVNLETKIIILVDELDRCRPDYALKVLERIKHFFNIPDYVFIFLNNKSEIEKSIEHVYGSENGSRYLEKFFDFQLKLPEPDKNLYVQLLYNSAVSKYKVDSFEVMMFKYFKVYLNEYCENFSLREIKKMFRYYKLIVNMDKIDTLYKMKHLPLHFLRKCVVKNTIKKEINYLEIDNKVVNIRLIVKKSKEQIYVIDGRGAFIDDGINSRWLVDKVHFKDSLTEKMEFRKVKKTNSKDNRGKFNESEPPSLLVEYLGKVLYVNYHIDFRGNSYVLEEYFGEEEILELEINNKAIDFHERQLKEIETLFNFFYYI